MRKPKEERVIEHSIEILEELHRIYKEGIGIDEYLKLLNEYKKLYKRYTRTIKLSDSMGKGVLDENDTLSENLQYTIKTARSKLLENVTEHRKTKEVSLKYKEVVKEYEEALQESYKENSELEKKLNYYIKEYGEIGNTFYNNSTAENSSILDGLLPSQYKDMSIKNIVYSELSIEKNNFTLIKIALQNFEEMIPIIQKNSSVANFILGTYKYIKNNLSKDDIVINDNHEVFYIIIKNKSINQVKESLEKLNRKRTVMNFPIKFHMGLTQFIEEKDNADILLRRCENAFLLSQTNEEITVK